MITARCAICYFSLVGCVCLHGPTIATFGDFIVCPHCLEAQRGIVVFGIGDIEVECGTCDEPILLTRTPMMQTEARRVTE